VFLAFSENCKCIAKSHFSDNLSLRRRDSAMFGIHHVCQPQFGDRKDVGVERLSDELATHLRAGEIYAGGFVANEIGDGSFCPEAFRFRIFGFHGNSIRWRYQMVCDEIITTL